MSQTTSGSIGLRRYAFAIVSSVVALVVTRLVDDPKVEPNTVLLFLASVMCTSWYGGLGPGLLATLLTALAATFFHLAPASSWALSESSAVRLVELVAVCVLISILNEARRRSQARAERAVADAEAANRIKNEFLAKVSHDLRTPLGVILGWTEVLRLKGADPSARQRALEIINRSVATEVRLVEDLLDVSRTLTGQLRLHTRPLDLTPIIQAAIDALSPALEAKALTLYTELQATAPVLGDPERLQQILWNLLSNAVKFTPTQGSVSVVVEEVEARARVIVSDSGPGIDSAALPHIFEPFYQGTAGKAKTGLGLGLAIAHHLAELHGGGLCAENTDSGTGTRFVLELPTIAAVHRAHAQ